MSVMPSTIAICKFVGTVSLGLLTGVSYTLSTQSLPSLLTLPSARPAAYTLNQTTRLAALHIRSLSALASLTLALAFFLSPPRIRHPYLAWTSLAAGTAGAMSWTADRRVFGATAADESDDEVNGEQVERRARDRQWIEGVRAGVSGVGFAMAVIGLWGDGA